MPFRSRRQQRWAHATRQPFARRWDRETPSFAALPEKKDAGPMLHGSGGLLGALGMGGGRLRKRLKVQTSEDRAMFAKMGGGGKGGGSATGGDKLWPKGPSGKRTPQAEAASQGEQTNTQKAERAVTDAEKGQVFGGMLRRDQDAGTYEARAEFADKTYTDSYTSKTLPVSSLIAETNSFQPDRVARFMSESAIRKGDAPTVMQYDGKNYLMDGHHRVLSRVALGENKVLVRVYTVTGKTPPESRSKAYTTKPMTRSEAASVAAHARWDKTPRKAKPPTKGRKPAKTEQQRAEERQGKQRERDDARATQRAQNRADVLRSLNIAPDGAEALAALRDGKQPDAAAIARGGFVDAGLVEQAADGSYRMTPAGRAVLSAADAGDRGRAGDTISGGRDRVSTRRQRQQAAAERKKKPKQVSGGGGGGKEPPKPKIDVAGRMRRINSRLARMRKRRKLPVQTTKAQTAEDRAMFAKMGGGGKGGGGGALPGGGLWARNPETGKREPTAKQRKTRNNAIARERQQLERRATRLRPIATLRPKEHGAEMRAIGARMRKLDDMIFNQKSFVVYKSHDGTPRWLARTTTAYRDRDREIIAIKALDQDSQRMTAARQFGPLRFWHLGRPDPLDPHAPWGPGLDVGDCDFSIQIGTTRVESGTFKSAALAQRIADTATEYELSPGFFHPPNQPSADGVFTAIRTFERSLVPIKYGRASNLFTGLTVKGVRMEPDEMERRFKAAIEQLRLPPDQAAALSAGLIQADKSAQQQGIAYKSDDGAQTVVINGVTYKAEAPAYEPPPDVVINGVTYKAMPPEFADEEEKADFGEGEAVGEEMADMGMSDEALMDGIADRVFAKIAPLFSDMKMSELKALFSGMSQKDDSRAQEIASLKAVQDQLAARLAQLTGDQPKATLPDDVAAALKSTGPQAPPDPNAPQIPADASPLTQLAARLAPQLYSTAPNGAFNGWAPPTLPQS